MGSKMYLKICYPPSSSPKYYMFFLLNHRRALALMMGRQLQSLCIMLFFFLFFFSPISHAAAAATDLSVDYYATSCPNLEKIVHAVVEQKQKEAFVTAAGTLRIFFHDCFVEGCDASVMVASTLNNTAEKDAEENLSLPGDGFDAVMRAKEAVEDACPGVVSCADILSIATRDLVGLVGGPYWPVVKGRKDGKISLASKVAGNLPKPTMNVEELGALFQRKGFTLEEMVVLSGAHTVGFSHCGQFIGRIWNFSEAREIDPAMKTGYAMELRSTCPNVALDPSVVAFNDLNTPTIFDNVYFRNVQQKQGLLASDQALWSHPLTRKIVHRFASSQTAFFSSWIQAAQKLSLLDLKTEADGEVRKQCNLINTT